MLPKGLDDTYGSALERILPPYQHEDNANLAMRALKWVTFSRVYLNIEEIQHALAVAPASADIVREPDDLVDIPKLISLCVGLVTLHKENRQIRLVHYTAQKYLEDRFKADGDAEIAITLFIIPTNFHVWV